MWRKQSDRGVTFSDSDACFMNAFDIADFRTLRQELFQWESTLSDSARCMDLINPTLASSHISLEDENCPTLLLLDRLHELEWRPFRRRFAIRISIQLCADTCVDEAYLKSKTNLLTTNEISNKTKYEISEKCCIQPIRSTFPNANTKPHMILSHKQNQCL